MELITAVKERRSIRKFQDKKVPRELLEEIVNISAYAPSWKNTQVARYVIVDDEATIKALATEEVAYGFDMNGLENGIRGLEHGLCDGFYELNTGLLTGFGNTNMAAMQNTNAITSQLSNMAAQSAACCCETQRLIERGLCEVNYNILTQSNGINTGVATAARDIIENNNAGVRSILDFLTQDKISTLQAENQALRLTASQQAQNAFLIDQLGTKSPIPAYVVANPYANYGYGVAAYGGSTVYGGCGCG